MPGKRKQYEKAALQAAIREVHKGKSVSKVAKLFGVPFTTLYDHAKGKLQGNLKNPGIESSLNEAEEEALIRYMRYMGERGQPLTMSVLKRFVTAIIKRGGRRTRINLANGPSKKWCRKFFKRHHELKCRKPDKADDGRLNITRYQVEEYFTLLSQTITNLQLHDKPECIFNCDETGFNGHEISKEKVLVVGKQHPYQKHITSNFGHITLQVAVSGDGRMLPPMVIFSRNVPHDLGGVPDSWRCVASPKGYMDTDLFCKWMEDTFIPNCGRHRPVLLIMDNLGAHLTPRAIDIALDNQIELLALPAHSTHLLEPLDVRIFHILKGNFTKAATRCGFQVNRISRSQMPVLIKHSLNMLSPWDIVEAFRLTGIIPCNPDIISKLKQSLRDEADDAKVSDESNSQGNPLVNLGIIPASLEDILVPPPPPKRSNKKPLNARLLTAQEPQPSTSAVVETEDQFIAPSYAPVIEQYANDGICVVCMTNRRMEWVGCDVCPNWFHYDCLNAENKAKVDISMIINEEPWCCGFCEEE